MGPLVQSRRRLLAPLAVLIALLAAASPAAAAPTLSSDEPPALGSSEVQPTWDANQAGMAEAFSFQAADDGPVDVVNVYLDRHWDTRKVGRPGARLIAGIYADDNGRPGELLGDGSITSFRYRAWNTVPIEATELEKGEPYWIAVLGLRDEFVFRTSTSPATGTAPSVTSPTGLNGLQSPWKTNRVFPKDSPISAYAAERYSVLVFTKNATGNSAEGVAALRSLAKGQEVTFDVTDDASKFTEENLAKYRVVVFLNNAGELLDGAQQDAFEAYFRGGGGFLGIHSAIEAEPSWSFLTDVLGTRAEGRTDPLSATTKVADRVHIASKGLPEYWTRTDRWYNFTSNVRGVSHVLATVDENTYSGGTDGFDHPIAWCKDYQGGRSFYTGAGGTPEAFGDANVRRQLAGALDWAAGKADPTYSDCGATVLANFQQTKISAPPNINEPIGIDQLPDGRILQTVRDGRVRLHDPVAGTSTVIATIPVYTHSEDGLYGPAVDANFAENKWVYFYYAPLTMEGIANNGAPYPERSPVNDPATPAVNEQESPLAGPDPSVWDAYRGYFQLSRFKFVDGPNPTIDLASEQKIMKVEVDRGACCHVAGDIDFDKDGNLWLVTGDDTPATAVGTSNNPPINDQKTANEVQNLSWIVGQTTGGTFTLTFDGQTTAPIAFPINNGALDAALEALPNVDLVTVAGNGNNPRNITFGGAHTNQDVPQLTVNGAGLTGPNPGINAITTIQVNWFWAPFNDARRGSTNTNDLRGKILRIKVNDDGSYSVPSGNMFAPGTPNTRPEIYAMGFRNPFRIQVDEDGVAHVADYSPDSNSPTPLRAAAGTGRIEIVRKPSNYGWPMCYKTDLPMFKWDFNAQTTLGVTYECDNPAHGPENESRWNTGQSVLPPITDPDVWYSFRDDLWGTPCFASYNQPTLPTIPPAPCPRIFPELGQGGVGPHVTAPYDYDPDSPSTTKFPPYYDKALFFGEWTRDYLREIRIDSNNKVFKINNVLNCGAVGSAQPFECDNPMDGQFGADGNFYLLTYGDGFFTQNPDAGVYRWSYVKGQRAPNAVLNTDRTDGAVPLTVQFSSEGTRDPDPGDGLFFEWDFDGDGTVDSTDPSASYTYTQAGVYTARLVVKDPAGNQDVKTVTITAGNTSPVVTITTPVDGDFFDWGESIPYTVTVVDPEDGPIDCNRVVVTFILVHDQHGHAGADATGCSGSFPTNPEDANHGGSVAAALNASYTDLGANGQPALTGNDQNIVNERRQQVEFVFEQSGTNTAVTTDPTGGGQQRGSLASGDWIALNRSYDLRNMDKKIRFRFAGGDAANPAGQDRVNVEIRSGSATGPLITTATLKSTGSNTAWSTQDFDLDYTGAQRLFLVFRQIPGGPAASGGSYGNLNWVEFTGPGVGGP